MLVGGSAHLTYCTNVHPGERWPEVRHNLLTHVAAVKAEVCPARPFGVGLWLSAEALRALGETGELERFKELLSQRDLYVFTLNGFPYGAFHGRTIKEHVYEPDWRDPRRLAYSNALAELLAELLPEGVNGSISTLPGAFKPSIRTPDDERAMADQLIAHVARLHALFEATGKRIALALEPEPCCYLETSDETVAFFERHLRSPRALRRLCELAGVGQSRVTELLERHLGVCLDTCHAAVEHEQPAALVAKLRAARIPIVKLQLSSGLRIEHVDTAMLQALRPYLDEVYLHQVVERRGEVLTRYLDLPQAISELLASSGAEPPEWRVHFHVPVFLERMRSFGSTQAFLREILALHLHEALSEHLEVETYTWEVLPEEARPLALTDGIVRELRFCLTELGARAPA
jgi:sugar phosphate isomerase/epimerase